MRILIVTPTRGEVLTGNRCTAADWERILDELGHGARVAPSYAGQDVDLLVALHAQLSHPSVRAFQDAHPGRPIVVALTGTDTYPELGAEALESLHMATRIVGLQPAVRDRVPVELRGRVRIVLQSAAERSRPARDDTTFRVAVVAHMRSVKDPFRAADAVRLLAAGSRLRVVHAGAVLEPGFEERAIAESRENPRWRWVGELSPDDARELIAGSDLLVLSSHAEGGARVVGEAAAAGTPVVVARNEATTSLLGPDYPGLFEPGDTAALAALLGRAETDEGFLERLRAGTVRLRPLVAPERERERWADLLAELTAERSKAT